MDYGIQKRRNDVFLVKWLYVLFQHDSPFCLYRHNKNIISGEEEVTNVKLSNINNSNINNISLFLYIIHLLFVSFVKPTNVVSICFLTPCKITIEYRFTILWID